MAKCDPTPVEIASGVAYGDTQAEAEKNAYSAGTGVEKDYPCPRPCESWYFVRKGRARALDADAYKKMFGLDEEGVILSPKFQCAWKLFRKCLKPRIELY